MNDFNIVKKLRQLNNLVRRTVDNSETKKMIDDVTGTNGFIIAYLSDHSGNDVFQKDLEEEFGITRSTASKIISLMEKKGLVRRLSVPNDARLKKLELTERSQELSALMNEDRKRIEDKIITGFTEDELCTLQSFIERMKANINS